ncbi:MAG: hypothetical protein ABI831_01775 [Betaproteobacteria bacterium]
MFDTQPAVPRTLDDFVERRFAQWEAGFRRGCVDRLDQPNCRVYRYTANDAIPAEFNQQAWRTPTELRLWIGPRIDMTAADLLHAPIAHDLNELAAAALASPGTLDTAVCVSYRAIEHSLIVKTDVLNSTFVYWARSGRWLLLSNSSLTLARLIRARMDPVAASEFLASGSIYANGSLYEGIGTLQPATLYAFTDDGPPASHAYWRIDTLPFNTLSAKEACARVIEELDRDFDALNATGKTFILDLTGGYDSRTNLGFALRRLKHFQTTVSGRPEDEDVVLSSALARHFGLKHTVIALPAPDDPGNARRVADSALLTDLEYDIVEYSRIYNAQSQFDSLQQPSIHGSGGGDIARNIILRPEYCETTPDGRLVVEALIAQRFRNLIPPGLSRPDLPIADWVPHMRRRIAEHDVPHLPAYVRLDIIYLRMRMQYWQGRIGSSTNRFRSSFSPWTNRRVLEAMLTTHWKERDHQMLSRLFLRALHPDLSCVGVARGEPAGPRLWDVVAGAPARARYYAGRVSARLGWARTPPADPGAYRDFIPRWEETVGNVLRPEAVSSLIAADGPAFQPQVLGRLVTLAHVRESLDAPFRQ